MNMAYFSCRSTIAEPMAVAMAWLRVIIKAACVGMYAIITNSVTVGFTSFTALSLTMSHNLLPAYEGAEDLSWARGPLWFGAFDVPKEMDSTINPHTM
ncbi:hypothetical protein ABEW05_001213 [Botrytis cinerea]